MTTENQVDSHTVLPAYNVPSTESTSQDGKKNEEGEMNVVYKEASDSEGHEPGSFEGKAAAIKSKVESFFSWRYLRAPVLIFTACLIFGWWMSGLFVTRDRWCALLPTISALSDILQDRADSMG